MPETEGLSVQIQEQLLDLKRRGLLRNPGIVHSAAGKTMEVGERKIRVFCSNNYLDLANDQQLVAAVKDGLERWGWGSGASRLICGSSMAHVSLEQKLGRFKGCEAAVLFPTGYMANLGVLTTLAGSGDVLLIDKLCHASIIDAARSSQAIKRYFPHNDMIRLASLLCRYKSARRLFIVTEGIFSMGGDYACLEEIVSLKRKYGALLIVDDAHGTGVLGEYGRGTAELLGVEKHIDVTVATLSKALGSLGGFVCCASDVAEYLRNCSRSYVYTTAVPPAVCLAGEAALKIIQDEPQRRHKLIAMGNQLRDGLRRAGFDLASAQAHIIPVMLGRTDWALRISELLWQQGFMIPAIREPTVARGKARLRISLMSSHTAEDVNDLTRALIDVVGKLGLPSNVCRG